MPSPSSSAGTGPNRALVLGCGAVFLLVGVVALFFASKGPEVLRWGFERAEAQVMEKLEADVDEAARARLRAAFQAAVSAAVRGESSPSGAVEARGLLESLAEKQIVSAEEVAELTRALESMAAGPEPAP